MQLYFISKTHFFLMQIQADIKFEKSHINNNYDIILKEGDNNARFVKK